MGDIWQGERLFIFLVMLVPGFISLKIWDLLVPSERRDFSKSLVEAIAYSAINFAALFWLVDYLSQPNLAQTARNTYLLGNFVLFFVHLRNGGVVGGKYDSNSYASSYPAKEQIYIEELWLLDEKRNFVSRIDRTKGSIVLGEDILAVEFFR